jgi:hypothetical protein
MATWVHSTSGKLSLTREKRKGKRENILVS